MNSFILLVLLFDGNRFFIFIVEKYHAITQCIHIGHDRSYIYLFNIIHSILFSSRCNYFHLFLIIFLLIVIHIHLCLLSRSFEVAATDKINREETKKLSETLTNRETEIKSLLVSSRDFITL